METTKAKAPIYILVVGLLMFITACVDPTSYAPDGNIPQDVSEEGDPMAILVLCDLSSSLDSNAATKIARNCMKLVEIMPYGSTIDVFPIEENTYPDALFHYKKRKALRQSDVHKLKDEIPIYADSIEVSVMNYYERTKVKFSSKQARSCIWANLQARVSWFDQYQEGYCRHLIVMSDMIEECKHAPIGSVYMQEKKFNSSVRSRIESYSGEEYSNYQDLNILCLITSSESSPSRKGYLPFNEIKDIWQLIFKRMGYQGKIRYQSSFPPNLTSSCHAKQNH